MKVYSMIFVIITIYCLGIHSGSAQEPLKNELARAEYHKFHPAQIAKMQTDNLRELLKLDNTQIVRVYEALYEVEKKMEAVTKTDIAEEAKMNEIGNLEVLKTEKLKEVLTVEQFSSYMDTIKSNKR